MGFLGRLRGPVEHRSLNHATAVESAAAQRLRVELALHSPLLASGASCPALAASCTDRGPHRCATVLPAAGRRCPAAVAGSGVARCCAWRGRVNRRVALPHGQGLKGTARRAGARSYTAGAVAHGGRGNTKQSGRTSRLRLQTWPVPPCAARGRSARRPLPGPSSCPRTNSADPRRRGRLCETLSGRLYVQLVKSMDLAMGQAESGSDFTVFPSESTQPNQRRPI